MRTRAMAVAACLTALIFAFGCGESGDDSPGVLTTLASWWSGDDGELGMAAAVGPNAPSGLTGGVASAFSANLSWTDNSNNETGFKLMRQRGSGLWVLAAKTGPNVTSFTDPNLKGAKTYNYRVMAFNATGKSTWSNTFSLTTPALLPISAPTSVAGAALDSRAILFGWTDNSNNETGFRVEIENGGVWSQIGTVAMNVTEFVSDDLVPNTGYRFRVRAYNSAGLSDYGTSGVIATDPDTTPPSAPALTAVVSNQTRIALSWSAATDDYQMADYWVYRDEARIAVSPVATRTYTDLNVPRPAVDTCYVVGARDTAGNLTESNEACAFTAGLSSAFTVSALPFGGLSAASDGENFFVGILHDNTTSGGKACGQLMNTKASPARGLSVAKTGGGMPNVVWNGSKYLMTWVDDGAFTGDFVGQYFSAAGDTVGQPFTIDGTHGVGKFSISAGANGKVLAAYTEKINDTHNEGYLYGAVIDGRTVTAPALLTSDTVAWDGLSDSSVAFNGTNWLVTYLPIFASQSFSSVNLTGRMVSPSLSLGTEIAIHTSTHGTGMVGVGYGDGKFLVAYADVSSISPMDGDLYGRFLTASGLTASLSGGVKTISSRPGLQLYARVAYGVNGFFVLFSDHNNDADQDDICDIGEGTCVDLWGQKVANDGSLTGPNMAIDLSPNNQIGALAYGAGRYMISVMNTDRFDQNAVSYISAHFMTP